MASSRLGANKNLPWAKGSLLFEYVHPFILATDRTSNVLCNLLESARKIVASCVDSMRRRISFVIGMVMSTLD